MAPDDGSDGDGTDATTHTHDDGDHHHNGAVDPELLGTTHPDWRWKWLSSVSAAGIQVFYFALVAVEKAGLGVAPLDNGTWSILTTAFMVALVFTFGPSTLKAWKRAKHATADREA